MNKTEEFGPENLETGINEINQEEKPSEQEPENHERLEEDEGHFEKRKANDEKEMRRLQAKIEGMHQEEGDGRADYEKEEVEGLLRKVLGEEHSFEEKFEMLAVLEKKGHKFDIAGVLNQLSQKTVDHDVTKDEREGFGQDIIAAIREAMAEGRLPNKFWEGYDRLISVGSGHGENPYGLLKAFLGKDAKAILIDPDAAPGRDIAADPQITHLGQRFEDVKIGGPAAEVPGKGNVVEASNFLQLYKTEGEKLALVKKMIRMAGVGGKLIIVDEIKRKGLGGVKDWALNRGFNAFQGNYARLNPGEYESMFDGLGLKRFTSGDTDQYHRGSVLFVLEVTERAMEKAGEKE